MWWQSPQPASAHSSRAWGGKDKKLKGDDLPQKLKIQILAQGRIRKGFLSQFLSLLWHFPSSKPSQAVSPPWQACPWDTTPWGHSQGDIHCYRTEWVVLLRPWVSLVPKGFVPWVLGLVRSMMLVETRELFRDPALLHAELLGLLGNISSGVWRAELGVAVLWGTRVSTEVSGTDFFSASGLLLCAVHKQMVSSTI